MTLFAADFHQQHQLFALTLTSKHVYFNVSKGPVFTSAFPTYVVCSSAKYVFCFEYARPPFSGPFAIRLEGVHIHTKHYGSVREALFDYGQYFLLKNNYSDRTLVDRIAATVVGLPPQRRPQTNDPSEPQTSYID
mgnify:CR=1 FL=1